MVVTAYYDMRKSYVFLITLLILSMPLVMLAQQTDTVLTLRDCVVFALKNQPAVKQASIDQQINEDDIRIGLSAWLPQVSTSAQYEHYFKNSAFVAGAPLSAANNEYSSLNLQASQVIYNNDVLQAAKAARYSRIYYKQNVVSSQINVVAGVSKAFFDVLLSRRQLDILNEDIKRLQRSLKDAYDQYLAGTVDKTDYKQATISLNNSIAARKQTAESIKSKLAYLKQLMGVPADLDLRLTYDSTRYEQEAYIDTMQRLDLNNRVEYKMLQTQKNLEDVNVRYYKWGFLPSVSANGNYNFSYLNSSFSDLYRKAYPTVYAGLSLTIPVFQGTKRLRNLDKARLEVERTNLDIVNTGNTINTEYVQALSDYKSNYTNWELLKQNVGLAKDVYRIVSLQYREGVKTYLDVIVSQSDLRTAELNYYNALFQLLSSKIDLEQALGTLNIPQTN